MLYWNFDSGSGGEQRSQKRREVEHDRPHARRLAATRLRIGAGFGEVVSRRSPAARRSW